MSSRKKAFSDQLRQAIRDCGMTRYAIWKKTGVSQSLLSRFMSGQCGISMEVLDKLSDALDLELRFRKKGR